MSPAALPPSIWTQIEALIDYETLWDMAAIIPDPPKINGGRPRHNSRWALMLFNACCPIYGSARRTAANLPDIWDKVRARYTQRYPDKPPLPGDPPSLWHWNYAKKRIPLDAWQALRPAFRESSALTALEIGLFDPASGSFTHPQKTQLIFGDGKVAATLSKYTPGEKCKDSQGNVRPRRADPDADWYYVGGNDRNPDDAEGSPSTRAISTRSTRTRGLKTVHAEARGPQTHHRVVLDFDACRDHKELTLVYEVLDHLASQLDGLHGVVWDGAAEGAHAERVGRRNGLHLISPPPPNKGGHTTGKDPEYVPRYLESKDITHTDGSVGPHQLVTIRGAIHVRETNSAGDEAFVLCPRIQTLKRPNSDGTWRLYNTYALPASSGGGTFQVRLLTSPDDTRRGINRSHWHRSIPPADNDYHNLYHLRSDAESLNRAFDDTHWLRRARSLGMKGHLLDWLAYSLLVNALARSLYRRAAPTIPTQAETDLPPPVAPPAAA